MEKADTLLVDKTGTLTEGKSRLVTVQPFGGFARSHLLRLAASLERAKEHPLAHAIVEGAQDPAEPVLGVRLRRGRCAARCRRALPRLRRAAAEPDDRQRGDELQLRIGHRNALRLRRAQLERL